MKAFFNTYYIKMNSFNMDTNRSSDTISDTLNKKNAKCVSEYFRRGLDA